MQPIFRKLSVYQSNTESFSTYVRRACQGMYMFFMANGVAEDKQLPVFLSVRAKTFAQLCNLTVSTKPQSKTLIQVIEVLEKHFKPKPPSNVFIFTKDIRSH